MFNFQYIHQLGSRINCYTNSIFGDKGGALARKRSAPPRHNISNDNGPSFRNVDSFVSVKVYISLEFLLALIFSLFFSSFLSLFLSFSLSFFLTYFILSFGLLFWKIYDH